MKQFINAKENIVQEAIEGVIATSSGNLVRLDGYPHIRIVMRKDIDKSKVALVSGGGSGHEPAHAGFVGKGMLTAAVCGDVFASPSVEAILAGILAVTGDAGCLLIVKNYTGDRLNFGLAAERARVFGLNVNMVIVGDDVALPDIPQARGIAGTMFVHKILGALSEQGKSLDEITETAKRIIPNIKTIGIALETCKIPGSEYDERIYEDMCELGLGIHGEPGVKQLPYQNAKTAMHDVVEKLTPYVESDKKYVALLNNLGGASALEMSIIANELVTSSIGGNLSYIIGPASLVTSLDMHGFSVSLYPATNADIEALESPTQCIYWPQIQSVGTVEVIDLPDGIKAIKSIPSAHEDTKQLLQGCCEVLVDLEEHLNFLDSKSGDGDTGSTLASAANALIKNLHTLPLADHTQLYRAIGQELSETMGGSSGVLLAILFAATGEAASNGHANHKALLAGLNRMKEIGGANLGDRTMVDALEPALLHLPNGIDNAAKAAREGANKTSLMLKAKAGRASYVSAENLKGNIDPGAEAVARLFEFLAQQKSVL